jgi:DUF1707 SHOCT-like domain
VERLPESRVSDAEREQAAARLRDAAVDGRLTLDELSDRLEQAYGARTAGELEAVVADLPVTATPTVPAPRGSARRTLVAIMSGHQLRGRFRLAGSLTAIAFMGGCEIDLRHAVLEGSEVKVRCFAFMGGIDVVVPEGIEVHDSGFAFMGGRNMSVKDARPLPGTPLVRIQGYAVMGAVNVRSRRHLRMN